MILVIKIWELYKGEFLYGHFVQQYEFYQEMGCGIKSDNPKNIKNLCVYFH